MSRYNGAYDTDAYRLPDGFKRTGYDADTEEYFFTSGDGKAYKSLPGNTYGKLIPVESEIYTDRGPTSANSEDFVNPFEVDPVADDDGNKKAWRHMLPFFLLVGLTLLFLIKVSSGWPRGWLGGSTMNCGDGAITHVLRAGETCWSISEDYQTSVDTLKSLNENMDCASLVIGRKICVPFVDTE